MAARPDKPPVMVELSFKGGTLELRGLAQPEAELAPGCTWDERTACFRAPAQAYADVLRALVRGKVPYEDHAREYEELPHGAFTLHAPRPFQKEALLAWERGRSAGVVVLPTGAGKSQLGIMAIDRKRRSTLVVAPTLDLVRQWYDLLRAAFRCEVGVVGGGDHRVEALTVTTYDSAYLRMEDFGHRFGLVIFDEVHHLPGESYAIAARQCLAPFRLGLTATPERADGRENVLDEVVGPILYRQEITDLSGRYLSDYDTERVAVELSPEEREEYEAQRAVYLGFVRSQGIHMGSPDGWGQFIMRASRSEQGQRAMKAYRRQRELAFTAPAKLEYVDHLLHQHRHDRCLLFTQDNATAYTLSRRFLLPAITHQTRVTERSAILQGLKDGTYGGVVTSKVLNEGVDVPSANVAIVVSGSGSVREHVQRLGRVLRKQEGKRAILYELVTANTAEAFTSERRREHSAYRG